MKYSKVTLNQQLNYILITIIAGVVGDFVWGIAIGIANSLVKQQPSEAMVNLVNVLFIILIALSTTIVIGYLIKNHVYQQYYESNDDKSWIYSCIKYYMIGEIVKFVVCMIPINTMRFGSYLNRISRILFDLFYLDGRHNYNEFLDGSYIVTDFIVYFFVQLLSLIIVLPLLVLIYRHHWQNADKEHRELTRYMRND